MRLKYLFVIVDKFKTRKVTEALIECGANALNVIPGTGTAPTALGDILGTGEKKKSNKPPTLEERYMEGGKSCLKNKFDLGEKRAAGWAFTVPEKGVGGPATLRILAGECAEEETK